MIYSSLIIAALLQTSAFAADQREKQHVRRTAVEDHEEPNVPHKHQPRGEKSSSMVTYFTMGGKEEKKKKKKKSHDGKSGAKEARIVGGSQSDPGEFPYYVDLGGCGGSLIAPNVVLTAAHCGNYQGDSVIVGAYRAGSTANNAVEVTVAQSLMHPNYDDFTTANDFQLLRLSQAVTVGGSNVVLSINNQFSSPSNNQLLTVLGLGLTQENGNEANILRDVEVQAIATSTCNQGNAYGGDVENDTMFCAGYMSGGKDSCQGDSGGPIVIRNGNQHVQVGVTSWGDGCAQPNKPGVYARMSSAFNWIEQVVCDQWQSNASFCGNTGTPPGPTPPAPTPPAPTPPALTPNPPSPTPPSSGCPSGQMEFEFTIRTDDWGEETSWEVVSSTGKTLVSGSNYESDKTYRKITCIPDGCYTLTIFDDYGDGLSDGGRNPGYELKIDGQVVAAEGGVDFGHEKSIDFGTCGGGGGSGGGGGGGSVGGSCLPITLNLRTDDYGSETDLFLLTDTGNLIWNANGFSDNKEYQFTTCLDSSECATLDIFDEWGDGIEYPGFIKLTVDGTVYYNSGDFGGGIVFRIGLGC